MPQLDLFSYNFQLLYFLIFFLFIYWFLFRYVLPSILLVLRGRQSMLDDFRSGFLYFYYFDCFSWVYFFDILNHYYIASRRLYNFFRWGYKNSRYFCRFKVYKVPIVRVFWYFWLNVFMKCDFLIVRIVNVCSFSVFLFFKFSDLWFFICELLCYYCIFFNFYYFQFIEFLLLEDD